MTSKYVDCFKLNIAYWKFLGLWPTDHLECYFKYYSIIFIGFFDVFYIMLLFANFYFLPRKLDIFIEDMMFTFTEVAILIKVLCFVFMRTKIEDLFDILESEIFQPDVDNNFRIAEKAKRFIIRYWKIVAFISYGSNLTHVLTPLFVHIILPIDLELPVCSYSFLPEHIKQQLIYPLYAYQSFGMHCHMLYNTNIDGFFMGLMVLCIAQMEMLDYKLRHVTSYAERSEQTENITEREYILKLELDKCFRHFDEIVRFCSLIEEIFSLAMFVQFSMSSCIICVCLFRFTLPAPVAYYVFLTTYMTVMIFQIMVPCWFGSRMMETSSKLSVAIYNCDWTTRPRQFKSSLRLFVERLKRPLSITALKMFPLSLVTFTSIMNSAYSFFTLLRHVQTQEA